MGGETLFSIDQARAVFDVGANLVVPSDFDLGPVNGLGQEYSDLAWNRDGDGIEGAATSI